MGAPLAGVVAGLFALLVAIAPASAQDGYEERVDSIEEQIDQLEDNYLRPALLRSEFELETRLNDAKVSYMMEDYGRAAILFVGLVNRDEAEELDSYREALYLLGDSLYQERNFLAARKYFRQVVDRGRGRYYQRSVAKLLDLAARTHSYEGLEDLYDTLDAEAEVSPAAHYARAKLLYDQGELGEARRFFQKAAADEEYRLRAEYFRGVAFVADGQFSNARQVFEEIVEERGDEASGDSEIRKILDLCYLGLGRIAYEQEEYDLAIDAYQHLKRDSEYFDEMLYELTWTFIAQENYEAASRVTDIFLYTSNPEPTFIPKVQLLRSDLLLRLQKYDEARDSYQDVVDSFDPVSEELAEFAERERDLDTFFEELVEAELRGERPNYLPRMVQQWVDQSADLEEAKLTIADLADARDDIEDSYRDVERMEARLESGAEVESFPELAEGVRVAVELESRLISLRQDLVETEYEMTSSAMSSEQRREWEELEAEVDDLRERYQQMPKSSAEVRERRDRVEQRFEDLHVELDRVQHELDAQNEQLDAIDDYLDNPDAHGLDDEDLDEIEQKRTKARERISTLRELESELRREVEVARERIGMGDKTTRREQETRREYAEMLQRQRDFLEEIDSEAGQIDRDQLDDLQSARRKLPELEERLQSFFERMDELVGERAEELRRELASEREYLEMLDEEVVALTNQSIEVTAQVARLSFEQAKRNFQDLVMRGDIGLIDVAWQKKEDITDEINDLFEDRSAELKALQESFEEVR